MKKREERGRERNTGGEARSESIGKKVLERGGKMDAEPHCERCLRMSVKPEKNDRGGGSQRALRENEQEVSREGEEEN